MPPAPWRREPHPQRRLPGAGSITPEPPPGAGGEPSRPEALAPEPLPEPEGPSEPIPFDVVAWFATAARALTFAEQAMQAAQRDDADCYRDSDGGWWVTARLPLSAAREMAGLCDARLYVRVADGYVADRGWGDDPGNGPAAVLADVIPVPLLELVRVAGLHRVPPQPLREACVIVPGHLVPGVLDRAQDLRLGAAYQQARLDPLFVADETATSRVCYVIWLTAGPAGTQPGLAGRGTTGPGVGGLGLAGPRQGGRVPEAVPAALLAALADDPFALVCRPVEQTLLVGYGTASPLSDRALTRLVAADGGQTWLLAAPPDGCAQITWTGAPLDASGLVQLGPAHALVDLNGSQPYAEPGSTARGPVPRPLTLVPAAPRTARVDAMLLDDADLDCLPLLLAGDRLADSALIVRGTVPIHGTARHLLTAPGGLLTELAIGEPLTCIGPGSIYVPTGFRLDPPVGPAARAALFQPDQRIAQVVLREARLGYELDAAEPGMAAVGGTGARS